MQLSCVQARLQMAIHAWQPQGYVSVNGPWLKLFLQGAVAAGLHHQQAAASWALQLPRLCSAELRVCNFGNLNYSLKTGCLPRSLAVYLNVCGYDCKLNEKPQQIASRLGVPESRNMGGMQCIVEHRLRLPAAQNTRVDVQVAKRHSEESTYRAPRCTARSWPVTRPKRADIHWYVKPWKNGRRKQGI